MSENENKWTPKEICAFPKLSGSENHKGFRIIARAGSRTLAEVMPIDEAGAVGKLFADKLVASYNACAGMADPAKEIEMLRADAATWKEMVVNQQSDIDKARKLLARWDKSDSHYVETLPEIAARVLSDAATLAREVEAWRADDEASYHGAAVYAARKFTDDTGALARCREVK